MDYKEKNINGKRKRFEKSSFSERGRMSEQRRRGELRAKLTLVATAFVLIAVMVVLGVKLSQLSDKRKNGSENEVLADTNKDKLNDNEPTGNKGSKKDNSSNDKNDKDESGNKNQDDKTDNAVDAVSNAGQSKWIRDDLDADKPMVALTFDDGPYAPVTNKILNTLKRYDARATFFVVGSRVPSYKDVLEKAYKQGNEIATHTYNHADLTKINAKKIKKELDDSAEVISDAIGCGFSALRPPGGNINDRMRKVIKVPMIYWSVDTQDWKSRNAKSVLKECEVIRDGDIVLMHDLYPTTAQAIKKLVPKLVKEGYQLVTVDELLYYKGIDAEAGKVYYNGR